MRADEDMSWLERKEVRRYAGRLIADMRKIRKSGLTASQQFQALDKLITKRGAKLRQYQQLSKEG